MDGALDVIIEAPLRVRLQQILDMVNHFPGYDNHPYLYPGCSLYVLFSVTV